MFFNTYATVMTKDKPNKSSKSDKSSERVTEDMEVSAPGTSSSSSSGPSLADVMSVTKSLQTMLAAQSSTIGDLSDKVKSLEEFQNGQFDDEEENFDGYVDDCHNESFGNPPTLSVHGEEPPAKRQRGSPRPDNVDNTAEGVPSTNRFRISLQKYSKEEKTSEAIDKDLASTVNSVFRNGLSNEGFITFKKDVLRPENCEGLSKVRINTMLQSQLAKYPADLDGRFQNVQEAICKGSTLLVQLLNNNSSLSEESVSKGVDALAFFGHANAQLNFRRRELLRNHVNDEFKAICSSNIPFTTELFGDDLGKVVKDIQEVNRVQGRTFRGGHRGRGRGRGNGNYRGRGSYSRRGGRPNQSNQARSQGSAKKTTR